MVNADRDTSKMPYLSTIKWRLLDTSSFSFQWLMGRNWKGDFTRRGVLLPAISDRWQLYFREKRGSKNVRHSV